MFHRSWGLMLIQANIARACTVGLSDARPFRRGDLPPPLRCRGDQQIATNVLKVKRMCELVRQHLPAAAIVVGGHVANIADLAERIDADWIVRGEVRVPAFPGRRSRSACPAPGDSHSDRHAFDGHLRQGEDLPCRGRIDPLGGLSDGLQLLRDLIDVRRQREVD